MSPSLAAALRSTRTRLCSNNAALTQRFDAFGSEVESALELRDVDAGVDGLVRAAAVAASVAADVVEAAHRRLR